MYLLITCAICSCCWIKLLTHKKKMTNILIICLHFIQKLDICVLNYLIKYGASSSLSSLLICRYWICSSRTNRVLIKLPNKPNRTVIQRPLSLKVKYGQDINYWIWTYYCHSTPKIKCHSCTYEKVLHLGTNYMVSWPRVL